MNFLRKSIYLNFTSRMHTAGVIIIGNEILKGQTIEKNANHTISSLKNIDVRVKKISVIPDDMDEIATEVSSFAEKYNYVITSGGIGPTHDDITYAAIARAFHDEIERNAELADLIRGYITRRTQNPADIATVLRMADIPRSSRLLFSQRPPTEPIKVNYPVVAIRNCFVLPGIPTIFRHAMQIVCDQIAPEISSSQSAPMLTRDLYLQRKEFEITPHLDTVVNEFKQTVEFGSYPKFVHSYYNVRINMESLDKVQLDEAEARFRQLVGNEYFIEFDPNPVQSAFSKLRALMQLHPKDLGPLIQNSLNTIQCAISEYGISGCCIAYTGGKDCLVVLHLLHALMMQQQQQQKEQQSSQQSENPQQQQKQRIKVLHISSAQHEDFEQVVHFRKKSLAQYGYTAEDEFLCEYLGDFIPALEKFREEHPDVRAILMGNRLCDPNSSKLAEFTETDTPHWPQFMRVFPILRWEYAHVWRLIRALSLSYCDLYDKGYTSLGSPNSTLPNPRLRIPNSEPPEYFPAHDLQGDEFERSGRFKDADSKSSY